MHFRSLFGCFFQWILDMLKLNWKLSILFWILRRNHCIKPIGILFTFNPFSDASKMPNGKGQIELARQRILSIPFRMLPYEYVFCGTKERCFFQSLFGCFPWNIDCLFNFSTAKNVASFNPFSDASYQFNWYEYNVTLPLLSIPFRMLQERLVKAVNQVLKR